MPDDRPVALDEYPVHQVPLSMKHVATSDRNAYDRCIFHVLDHQGRALLILGLGVYPNVGVIDAYATLRLGDRLHAVRASDALGDDRMNLAVGPLRITVEEPLRRLRLQSDDDSLSYDITWTADFPALWEPHHIQRRGGRLTLEGRRFVQAGGVRGIIRVDGEEIPVSAGEWTGTRDRSWGVRPIPGEEGGRLADDNPTEGFHWLWCPVRFEDRFLMVIAQEDADGHRSLNDATLVREGRRDLQLGWPQADISYRSGTRHPLSAVVHLTDPVDRKPLELGVEVLTSSPLAVGAGYPPADDWQHGTWRGRDWTDRRVYDLADPAAHPLAAYGVIDHSARFTLDGRVGYGIFEHGSFGRHDPSGFTGFDSVAP
ncbi:MULTISPECIES: hypothetical protein [unclassified Streptomyces]|uniref:hypothetical protein n=1 Tax=unclassified Streptomyces TaxID=2593676 RepID=UPI002E7FDD77|nr:hypothetical protein [Streptomyces sp. NBC_00589]WTI40786.1 hypothetical protein OIC96_40230 [Streptomyces sp. NBC_00775]WUB25529.1 hypothetical protein OHA51_09500 [Streptomyces sp. NBC_00589]